MTDEPSDRILQTAINAARAGGKLALSRLGNPGYMKWKSPRELQAGAVLDIQQRMVETIRADFADARFLVEEGAAPGDEQADPVWLVNPMDGTMNFNQSLPLFGVCIAYRAAGRYEVAVAYDPCHDELFRAVFKQGAYLNDGPINVTKLSE